MHCLPPDDSTTSALRYALLWRLQYNRVKSYDPERQPLRFLKSRLLIPNVHPYIYGIPKGSHLTENAPRLNHGHHGNSANTRTGVVIPNATSLVTAKFIQLV